MGAADGKRAVIGEAVGAAATALADRAAEAEQLPMFSVPTRFTGARAEHLQRALAEQRRQVGRPPGAKNRTTAKLREYFLARGVDPLEQMLRWSMHTPTSLAAELGITRGEAFRELRELWADLAPFFHAKQAAVDDAGNVVPQLAVNIGNQVVGAPGAAPPWIYAGGPTIEHAEENQGVSEAADEKSHGEQSHGVAK